MDDWRDTYADQNLRMARKMLEQQGEINRLKAEVAQLRDGNANLIRNAEILADELIHATAERDELAAALNEALPKLWTYERAQEETAE